MNPIGGLSSSAGHTPHAQESVKALHSRRGELKRRIQEKHMQRRGEMRRDILEAARGSRGQPPELGEEEVVVHRAVPGGYMSPTTSPQQARNDPYPQQQGQRTTPSPDVPGIVPFGGVEWSEFGDQYRVDVSEPAVMEYLLQLEEEIRQEQLVAMYEQAHNQADISDLEEHFQYLMS